MIKERLNARIQFFVFHCDQAKPGCNVCPGREACTEEVRALRALVGEMPPSSEPDPSGKIRVIDVVVPEAEDDEEHQ